MYNENYELLIFKQELSSTLHNYIHYHLGTETVHGFQ